MPLVTSYDYHERVCNPPMPLLFQRRYGGEHRPSAVPRSASCLNDALASTGITDASGHPLRFIPHDFRRIFITDAIMHGMPPHIAQLVAGHRDINTTMGYKAVYPEEVINGHRAFITRRRALRPGRGIPHPHRRRMGRVPRPLRTAQTRPSATCGRSYATPCIHEHACIRCPLLRPDPAQRPRLAEIRGNLIARIAEAAARRLARRSRRPAGQPRRHRAEARPDRPDHRPPPRHRHPPRHARPSPAVNRIATTSAAHPADNPKHRLTRENLDHF